MNRFVFTVARTPALSPGERGNLYRALGYSSARHSIQRQKFRAVVPALLVFIFCLCGCAAPSAQSTSLPEPIHYEHIVRHDPNVSIHLVKVNLKDSRVSLRVARGGADPDGDGPWLTTLLPTSEIAKREHFAVAINGDFFDAQATKDVEGKNTGYVRGKPAAPVGMAMTDGVLWHRPKSPRPYLEITSARVAKLESGSEPVDTSAREMVGGSQIIVHNGQAITFTNLFATARHPRTAVGIDVTGTKLTMLVVDGRQPELSVGMTLAELSEEMIQQGCAAAINLDGGGSSTLVVRNSKSKKLEVLNSPSDTKERSVADVLGVEIETGTSNAER